MLDDQFEHRSGNERRRLLKTHSHQYLASHRSHDGHRIRSTQSRGRPRRRASSRSFSAYSRLASSGDGGVTRLKHNAAVLAPFGPSATTGSERYASSPGPEYKASISFRGRSISTPYAEEPGSRTNVARFPTRIAYPGRAAGRTLAGCAPLDRSASASMNRP